MSSLLPQWHPIPSRAPAHGGSVYLLLPMDVHSWAGCTVLLQKNCGAYYTISMYAKPDPYLFLFSLYLCSSVDLGGFIQVYVRPESKPLLCQWNGSQELGWCAKQNTWLPGEMTWQELKQQTYRKCLLWNSRDLTVPLVFWNALIESCGVGAGCNLARTLGQYLLSCYRRCERN